MRSAGGAKSSRTRLPKVTVVVPCYNYGHFLRECVRSVISQQSVEPSVMIIDDASTDDSAMQAEKLAEKLNNVSLTRHASNIGHIRTYNEGISQADSDYVVLLSADDALTPGALDRATRLLDANPGVGLVYGHPLTFDGELPRCRQATSSWSVWEGQKWIYEQYRRGLGTIYSPEAVVRTSIQHQVGYYNPELPHSADLEMWLRIAEVSSVGRVNGADQAFRRVHPASMMQSNYGTVLADLKERLKAYESALARSNAETGRKAVLDRIAHRRASADALEHAIRILASSAADSADQSTTRLEIEQYLGFACEVWPAYRSTLAWKEYDIRRRVSVAGNPLRAGLAGALGIHRDVKGRLRWQKWYRFGL